MFHLGVIHWSGRGVRQDLVEAYKWFDLASAHATGERASQNASARDRLALVMPADRLAEARTRARAWQAAYDLRRH
jgi:TPR repeat protein